MYITVHNYSATVGIYVVTCLTAKNMDNFTLKCILKKYDWQAWRFTWLKIRISGRALVSAVIDLRIT